jgi:C-terminal processing protease CtpA/Prc
MALQDHSRATIIGEHTAGFGTALGEIILPDQSTAYIPHVIYRGPKGAHIEGKGVTPDIAVHDTSPYGYYQPGMPDAIMTTALAYLRGEHLQYARAPHE